MTVHLFPNRHISPSSLWLMLSAIPLLMAAGIVEQSGTHHTLPEEESYRSNFSETILDSSNWRKPQRPEIPWRERPRPPLEWRTPASTTPPSTSSRHSIELFPKYQPGKTTDFDPITREEKPLIKVFEFGS